MVESCSQAKKELFQFGDSSKKDNSSLRLKSEFDEIKANGSKFTSKIFILLHSATTDGNLKIGIICGRKFSKKAVTRNRVRRIVKEAFRLIRNRVASAHLIIIPRRGLELLKAQDIQYELIRAFKKTGLWNVDAFYSYAAGGSGLKSTSFSVTPEPISSALFLLGGGALALRNFRKRSAKKA